MRAVCLVLGAVGCLCGWGAEEGAALSEEEDEFEFRTLLFAAGTQQAAQAKDKREVAPDLPDFFIPDKEGYQPVDFPISGLSRPVRTNGAEKITFFTREPGVEEEWIYNPSFAVSIGSSWTSAVIILLPDVNRVGGLLPFAVNTTRDSFDAGEIKVYNLSPKGVVLNADGEIFPLQPLEHAEVDVSGIENNLLPVALALVEDSEMELVYRRRWSMRPTIRGIYFLFTLNEDYRRWYMRNIIL